MNALYTLFENDFLRIADIAAGHRKYLHAHPELSGKEEKTSQYITKVLTDMGLKNIVHYENHGLSVFLGKENSKTIAIRAEMDALPLEEANEVDYVSRNHGVMHACGHDVHMGIMLGIAFLLHEHSQHLPFGVKLIFQPSEETLPGGALEMINSGVLENPKVDYMLGLHVLPEMKAGKVAFRKGLYMASSDEIYLTLIGKGGHAAMPHLLNDPVVCAAQLVTTLQQAISRRTSPEIPSVLSFGKFIANGRTNVIPDVVEIEGTFRTFDEEWRKKAHDLIKEICVNTAETSGVAADLKIIKGYPVLSNDSVLTEKVLLSAKKHLGDTNVEELQLRMTADDFAYYTQHVPSCYFRIGSGDPSNDTVRNLHTPLFDVHEDVYITGLRAMTAALMVFTDVNIE